MHRRGRASFGRDPFDGGNLNRFGGLSRTIHLASRLVVSAAGEGERSIRLLRSSPTGWIDDGRGAALSAARVFRRHSGQRPAHGKGGAARFRGGRRAGGEHRATDVPV